MRLTGAVHAWIADECSRSTVKNSIAVLTRIMEQALRDGIIDRNPARVTGWQREYQRAEDELDDPRSLALADWDALTAAGRRASGPIDGALPRLGGRRHHCACTAARIGEISGVRNTDIDRGDGSGRYVGRPPRALAA